jgi:upstream activation factor subunit UAF30
MAAMTPRQPSLSVSLHAARRADSREDACRIAWHGSGAVSFSPVKRPNIFSPDTCTIEGRLDYNPANPIVWGYPGFHSQGERKMAAKKKAAKKPAKKKSARKPSAAFMKPMQISPALAAVIGNGPYPRTEVTKKLWAYIKKHGLQDSKNRRNINADDNLKVVFGGKKQVSMFDMTKLVSKQLK